MFLGPIENHFATILKFEYISHFQKQYKTKFISFWHWNHKNYFVKKNEYDFFLNNDRKKYTVD